MLDSLLKKPLANGIFKTQDFYGSGVRLVNVYDLYQDTKVNIDSLERINANEDEKQRFGVAEGDLYFVRSSLKPEGVAWTAHLERITEPTVFECHLIRAQPDEGKIFPVFLSHYSRTSIARDYLMATASVTTMATIDQPTIAKLPVVLPVPEKQRALVADMESARAVRQAKLSQADELLKGIDTFVLEQLGLKLPKEEKRKSFAVKLSKVKQGRQDALYYDPYYEKLVTALNKCKHTKFSLGELSPELVGGATPTRGDAELYAEDGIKFLRILNVASNEIVLGNVNYIQENVHSGELKRSQLAANDILMTITGRVGTSAVVTEDILPANINQHIVRMRIEREDCLPEYLAVYLNSSIWSCIKQSWCNWWNKNSIGL